MASKSNVLAALFLSFNLTFFVTASANTPYGTCPYDSLKLKVCVDVLNGLAKVVLGQSQMQPCCDLLPGVLDANVAACLCTAVQSTLLGIIPVNLSILVNQCRWSLPDNFHCA